MLKVYENLYINYNINSAGFYICNIYVHSCNGHHWHDGSHMTKRYTINCDSIYECIIESIRCIHV